MREGMYYKYVHLENKKSKDETKREIASALEEMLCVKFCFSPVAFVDIFLHREYIVSRLYSSPSLYANYSRICLKNLFPLARLQDSSDKALNIEINAAKPLLISSDERLPCSKYNCLLKPTNSKNPGFHFRIRYSIADSSEQFMDVFYHIMFGATGSSKTKLIQAVSKCEEVVSASANGYAVVFMTWTNIPSKLEVPRGSLLLHKQNFRDTLGPTIANFIESLDAHPILIKSNSFA